MIGHHTFIFVLLAIFAANAIGGEVQDEEIIKNLDFFQNLELIKDENPYIAGTAKKRKENSDKLSSDTPKSSSHLEKKQ